MKKQIVLLLLSFFIIYSIPVSANKETYQNHYRTLNPGYTKEEYREFILEQQKDINMKRAQCIEKLGDSIPGFSTFLCSRLIRSYY